MQVIDDELDEDTLDHKSLDSSNSFQLILIYIHVYVHIYIYIYIYIYVYIFIYKPTHI